MKVLGLVYIEPLRLAVVCPQDDQGKHGMRSLKVIRKKRKSVRT